MSTSASDCRSQCTALAFANSIEQAEAEIEERANEFSNGCAHELQLGKSSRLKIELLGALYTL